MFPEEMLRLLFPDGIPVTLEKAQVALDKGKIDPEIFWPDLGYEIDAVRFIAEAGAAMVDCPPGFVMAAMQMGASLVAFGGVASPIDGPEI